MDFLKKQIYSAFALVLIILGCNARKLPGTRISLDQKCDRRLVEVWKANHCPPREQISNGGSNNTEICGGVNNLSCGFEVVEDSVWAGSSLKVQKVVGAEVHYRAFFRFYKSDTGKNVWEHYLFMTSGMLNKMPYERRMGTFVIGGTPGKESLFSDLLETSCSNQASIFGVFDASTQYFAIERLKNEIAMRLPSELIEPTKNKGPGAILIDSYTLILHSMFLLVEPLTPEYWHRIVAGSYRFDEATKAEFAKALSSGSQTCFSAEGFKGIEQDLKIPSHIKVLIDAYSKQK